MKRDLKQELKLLLSNDTLKHLIFDLESLSRHFGLLESQELVRDTLLTLSKEDPNFIRRHIADSFIKSFGNFCRYHYPEIHRWPLVSEVEEMFKYIANTMLAKVAIQKCTTRHVIRKSIHVVPEWDDWVGSRRGQIPLKDRMNEIAQIRKSYLVFMSSKNNGYLETQLRDFALFMLEETSLSKSTDIDHLLTQFLSTASDLKR